MHDNVVYKLKSYRIHLILYQNENQCYSNHVCERIKNII